MLNSPTRQHSPTRQPREREHSTARHQKSGGKGLAGVGLAALGIAFGDLGTSPLYTFQTVVQDAGRSDPATLLGSLSLLVWALIIVVTLKYAVVVMRADNHGEGGILAFLVGHRLGSFVLLGGVFLALTDAETLYADMSHVGRTPVWVTWIAVVLPALLLSYAGQTAALSAHPEVTGNPFFAAIPHVLVVPMVALATAATIIASQAIITGSFTLTREAIQLGWFPGLNIRQTSDPEYGRIYLPVVNWVMMMVATLLITVGFRSSDRLSGACGTAVATTMLMTTALIYDVMRVRWNWSVALAAPIALAFLAVNLAFFVSNLLKIFQGGIVPLLIRASLFIVMTTWHRGIQLVREGSSRSPHSQATCWVSCGAGSCSARRLAG